MGERRESYAAKAATGSKWTGASSIYMVVVQLLLLAILARILEPSDFGLMAIVMVIVGFAQAFSDVGISNAIIHRQDTTAEQLSSLYWLNIIVGCIVFYLVLSTSSLVASFYSETRLEKLMFWTAFVFLITPFGQQFQVLLQKELRFKTLATIEIIAVTFGAIVSIIAAVNSLGVFSLVLGQLASSTVKSFLFARVGWYSWRPVLRFRKDDLKGYIGFGLFQMGERSIGYLGKQLDKIVIGIMLGPQALGYYSIAHQLMLRPFQAFNPIITRIIFPVFSKFQSDNQRLRRNYLEVIRVIALVLMPVYIGLIVLAELLLTLLLGQGWDASISVFRILAILGMFYSLGDPIGSLLLAKGRADISFYMNVMVIFLYGASVWLGSSMGLNGIAWALVIVTTVVFFPMGFWIRWRLIGMRPLEYLKSFLPFLVLSCIAGVVVLFVSTFTKLSAPAVELMVLLVIGAGTYLVMLVFFQRKLLRRLFAQARL